MKHEIQAPLIDGRQRSGIHSVCLVIQYKTKELIYLHIISSETPSFWQ
jgi:hypothetical protein